MKKPVHIFVIESEEPHSSTSVRQIWGKIKTELQHSGSLGKSEFAEASTKSDLQDAATNFQTWTGLLPMSEPIVLWLSIHGVDPEPGVPDGQRNLVGTSGASAKCEAVDWACFFGPIKLANDPHRVIVLMDVCWGSSPTAPACLATPSATRPAFIFGPARDAYRSELDTASESLFHLLCKKGIPGADEAKKLVDSINSMFPAATPKSTPFYRVWWQKNATGLQRYPEPPSLETVTRVKRP